jgi:rubredoxin
MKAYECGVCWHVYRPEDGDEVAQVPPGTRFEALPEDWRCPRCDAPKARYLGAAQDETPPGAADGRGDEDAG